MDRSRVLTSGELTAELVAQVRAVLQRAFGDELAEEDWQHALGGWHVLAERDAEVVAHAAVVPRELHVEGVPLRTGYVEAVATEPALQRGGLGSAVLATATRLVQDHFELGALSTGVHGFYERAGWERWQGPVFVRAAAGPVRRPDEDGAVMVLRFGRSATIALTAPISCEPRAGDDW